jgi:division protein CdvB (Snf7/Vps24/ESCRT-III family)
VNVWGDDWGISEYERKLKNEQLLQFRELDERLEQINRRCDERRREINEQHKRRELEIQERYEAEITEINARYRRRINEINMEFEARFTVNPATTKRVLWKKEGF